MTQLVVRLALLAIGLAFAELSLDAIARGSANVLLMLPAAVVLLAFGLAGYIRPLLGRTAQEEESRHV